MKSEKGNNFRMDYGEDGPGFSNPVGFKSQISDRQVHRTRDNVWSDAISKSIEEVTKERIIILNDTKLSARQKNRLIENNRRTLVILSGGKIKKTDNIIYGILFFGSFTIIALSFLNVFANLPIEVTMIFTGTVVGGTIATIAQKIEKIE